MKLKKAFTLAEVLITLTLIGVVAALTIPAVISNAQQVEYKTGLKKAVAALDEAVQLNIAIEGENPYQNSNLFKYLQRHMTVVRSDPGGFHQGIANYSYGSRRAVNNKSFYTKDGIRYEIYEGTWPYCYYDYGCWWGVSNGRCGNIGVSADEEQRGNWNDNNVPCVVTVDVNGDKKPHPVNFDDIGGIWGDQYPSASGNTVTDIFMILITKDGAVPYGTLAQKVMYSGAQRSRYY